MNMDINIISMGMGILRSALENIIWGVRAVRQSTCRMKQFFMTSFKQGFFELEPANLSFTNQQT